MSFAFPAHTILRRSVEGMEGMLSKMFDPPAASPATPDEVAPTSPVPEVMAAAGFLQDNPPDVPHTRQFQLMHGMTLPTWDGQDMEFFLFRDREGINAAKDGTFPAPTNRVPRGSIFHCETSGMGPPPHTIHWHGQEPTPMNDGVGHCSMELGHYVYQFQPNFIGSYFYHCHRNTMQHFEFGLYGFTIIDPPDAFFASVASFNPDGTVTLNNTPIGNGRPEPGFPLGRRRIAANLAAFPQFGQDNFNPLDTADPEAGNPNLPAWLKFPTDPHAHTVPYDVEALWVLDDRDINWSNLGDDPRATYPRQGSIPGVNDNFHGNAGGGVGPTDFFAFNDFRSTHFYCTGVPIPDDSGVLQVPGSGEVPHGIVIPPELMSGVAGVQVPVSAQLNQTVLLRVLNGAYNSARITFPVDVVIIAWDGRALGVPPYGNYNAPVLVPAGTPMEWSVARRFDCLIRSSVPVAGHATVEFIDTLRRDVRFTARIPIDIGTGGDQQTFSITGHVSAAGGGPLAGVTVNAVAAGLGGGPPKSAVSDVLGNYSIAGLVAGTYNVAPSLPATAFDPPVRTVTIAGDGLVGVDFAALAGQVATFSISGRVTAGGLGLFGVAMNLTGSSNAQTATDGDGNFAFAGLAPGPYTLTPSRPGFTFTPPSMPVEVVDASVPNRNFTATDVDPANGFIVSGSVVTNAKPPVPVPGVAVQLLTRPGNALAATTTTNGLGEFSFVGVADGKYSVVAALAGLKINPKRGKAKVEGANVAVKPFRAKPA
ncbi:MAG: hypothetical protein FJ291_01605 [Planctomycetes bacterium]|nr:hypothetical protein [Planctomycetota bacterium]